jgi:hypothetical protein
MKSLLLAAMLGAALLLSGCGVTLSVNPLYTGGDVVSDVPIEGNWTDQDGREIWVVRKIEGGYEVTSPGEKDAETLQVHLVRLGDYRFLDLKPRSTPSLAIEGHMFVKVRMEGQELICQPLDWSWLEPKLDEAGISHIETADKQVVLTASTAELRKFLLRYAGEPKAFDSGGRYHRVK